MKLKHIVWMALLGAAVLLAGCQPRQPKINVNSKEFQKKVTEGIYKVAKPQYAFNKTTDQLYFNKATNTFRIVSNDGSKWIEVKLQSPVGSVGETLKASLKSQGFDGVENHDAIEFEIMKKEGEKCWLWSQAHTLGVLAFYVK